MAKNSQLQRLKAKLKENGLHGVRYASKKSKQKAKLLSKEDDTKIDRIQEIRDSMNVFDKTAKNVKKANILVNANTNSQSSISEKRQLEYESKLMSYNVNKSNLNKNNTFKDNRFGERGFSGLSEEEKTLERYKLEQIKQFEEQQSELAKDFTVNSKVGGRKSKKSLYNLDEDDDSMFKLTHGGHDLFDDEVLIEARRNNKRSVPENAEEDLVPRKKTKKEVMSEIIAKSKLHKHERQERQNEMNEQILDLDEDFEDILSELKSTERKSGKPKDQNENIKFNDYDNKVKTLQFDKRAAPQDRVLSEKELLEKEEEEMKALEKQRELRMRGIFNLDNEDEERLDIEKLDEGFWNDEDEDIEEGEDADVPDSEDDIVFDDNKNEKDNDNIEDVSKFECPSIHKDLLLLLNDYPINEHVDVIKKIIQSYQPKLAEGNDVKLQNLTKVIFQHLQFLVDTMKVEENQNVDILDDLVVIFVKLIEKYSNKLVDFLRGSIQSLQNKFEESHESIIKPSTILFFSLIGFVYSTSDHYHLIVTPSLILINEFLEQVQYDNLLNVKFGVMLLEINNRYQTLSKRYSPESLYFVTKALDVFNNKDTKIQQDSEYEILSLRKLLNTKKNEGNNILKNLLINMEQSLSLIWNEKVAVNEVCEIVESRLSKLKAKYSSIDTISDSINRILSTIDNIKNTNLHHPLILQNHRLISIPLVTPKFEENFNPDKRYNNDISPQQNEINKLKKQIHKESKFQLKQFRKDSKFSQDLRTKEMIADKQAYHDKMKRIVNTINTEEGSERNMYEKEKKMRQGKK